MNITLSLTFSAIIILIVLIALDTVFLRSRKEQFDTDKSLLILIQEALHHTGEKIDRLKLNSSGQPLLQTANSDTLRLGEMAGHQLMMKSSEPYEDNTPKQSEPSASDTNTELPDKANETPAPQIETLTTGKTVHVQISTDISVGMSLTINIQTVKNENTVTVSHDTIVMETSLGQKSFRTAEIKSKPLVNNPPETILNAPSPAVVNSPPQTREALISVGNWLKHPRTKLKELKLTFPPLNNLNPYFFVAAAIFYLLAVSIGIDRFPIFFFTDEAVHTNLASEFVARGFTGSDGGLFPTYFSLGPSFGLNGVSVYLQVIPYLLFGKSVVVTRMVSALITLLAAMLVGLLLKNIFKVKSYWLGILLLIISPAWFLHSRTAFEYMEVASFFAAMLYFYNRYRQGEDKYLYATILAAALTFYTHGLGQVLAVLMALLLFISDFRYHFRPERRRTLLNGLGLVVLFCLPYLRYNLANTTAITDQIKQRGSYWMDGNFSLQVKVINLLKEYITGVNPLFWFFENSVDLIRHKMLGYGNILWVMLPFAILGIIRAVYKFREPEYRSILIALFVAPIPATIVAVGTPRTIWMIIPWVILIALGIDWTMNWVTSHLKFIAYQYINALLFLVLTLTGIFILRDALTNGPTWFTDYSLYGMQYGAQQVFHDVVNAGLKQDPHRLYVVSPSWANGTDQFVEFFVPNELQSRVSMGQPENFIDDLRKGTPGIYFVATLDEYNKLIANSEYKNITIQQELPYPDGKPGFYILTLNAADNINEIIAAEHEKNRTPVEDTLLVGEQSVRVVHSPLAGGRLEDIFDDNPDSLSRVLEANPFTFDIYPTTPIDTNSFVLQTGSLPDFTVTVKLYAPDASDPVIYTQTYKGLPPDPLVTIPFDKGPARSVRIHIEIKDNETGETSQIHVRTIQFK